MSVEATSSTGFPKSADGPARSWAAAWHKVGDQRDRPRWARSAPLLGTCCRNGTCTSRECSRAWAYSSTTIDVDRFEDGRGQLPVHRHRAHGHEPVLGAQGQGGASAMVIRPEQDHGLRHLHLAHRPARGGAGINISGMRHNHGQGLVSCSSATTGTRFPWSPASRLASPG